MLNHKYNLCYDSKDKEFHDDRLDKEFIEEIILPKSSNFQTVSWTENPYDKYDGYYNETKPIQVKNRGLNYSINSFPTTYIDYTAYTDLKDNGLLFIIYPKNNKVLCYNEQTINNAYMGYVYRDMWSWSEKNKSWYWEKNKKLAELEINKGKKINY